MISSRFHRMSPDLWNFYASKTKLNHCINIIRLNLSRTEQKNEYPIQHDTKKIEEMNNMKLFRR